MALQKLGKYEIRSELGRGAMGVVYKAYDPILEREVALKTMMASMGALDGESKTRFYREARSAAKLTHRNIVTIYDMGEEEGVPFIAMEFLDGIDLHRKLKHGGPLPLREGLEIISQVLRGLHYAHEFQIVHRDIKPANIYILRNGTAKILDFGIAKLASSEMTRTGMVLGTVDYMSPEQIRADKAVDGRSDLFSAGVILYEFITGRRPFPGETITSVMYKIVHEPPLQLPEDREIPPALVEAVNRSLEKMPDDRFRNGHDFAAALEDVIRQIDAEIPTVKMKGATGDSGARMQSAMRLYDSGSFEDSVAVLQEILKEDPGFEEAARLMEVVEKRAAGDVTMVFEPDEAPPSTGGTGSSIEEILEEVEEERRITTAATGGRTEEGVRDLTLRLEDSDVSAGGPAAAAPGTGAAAAGDSIPSTEILDSPEELKPPSFPETSVIETPEEAPPASRAGTGVAPARPAGTAASTAAPVVLPEPSRPAPARRVSPVMLGLGAVVLIAIGVAAYMLLGPRGGTAAPEEGLEGAPAAVAPASMGSLAVDAQPWAEIVRVRDGESGEEVPLPAADPGQSGPTTPLVLDLPEGTYDLTLRHPEFGEITLEGLRVTEGQVTPVNHLMSGFSFSPMLPREP